MPPEQNWTIAESLESSIDERQNYPLCDAPLVTERITCHKGSSISEQEGTRSAAGASQRRSKDLSYTNNFRLMMYAAVAVIPLVLLLRDRPRKSITRTPQAQCCYRWRRATLKDRAAQ